MDENAERDVSDSVTISLLISVTATGLIYFELWNGSVPAFGTTGTALGTLGGIVAGGIFFYTGTRSTRLEDIPPLAVFITLGIVVYFLFPEGLPVAAELGIIVGVWTDTALRAASKFA